MGDAILRAETHTQESKWREIIAVGSKQFVEATKTWLGTSGKRREVVGREGRYELREPAVADAYNRDFDPKNAILSHENTYIWNDSI